MHYVASTRMLESNTLDPCHSKVWSFGHLMELQKLGSAQVLLNQKVHFTKTADDSSDQRGAYYFS